MRAYLAKIVLLTLSLAAAVPAFAAEPAQPAASEDEDRVGWVVLEASGWMAMAKGASFTPATERPTDPYATTALTLEPYRQESGRYRAGYELNHNRGAIVATWWTHKTSQELSATSAGDFRYGEVAVSPLHSGVFEDGLADGFASSSSLKLRDLRLDYSRVVSQSSRATVRWLLGLRKSTHERDTAAEYYALFPVYENVPVIFPIPSDPTYAPVPDTGSRYSKFIGQGPEIGVEVDFPLMKRLKISTGLVAAILSGNFETGYRSTTSYYALMSAQDPSQVERILEPPYSEFEGTDGAGLPYLSRIRQLTEAVGMTKVQKSSAQVLDVNVELRYKAWRELEAFLGLRVTRYANMAADETPTFTQMNDLQRTESSVSYEGLFGGVSYRF